MEVTPGYKQTEVGVIPEDWECTTVGQLAQNGVIHKPMDGNHGNIHPKSGDFVSFGIPFVMANNVRNGSVDLSNCSFIRKEQADSLQKGFSLPGDVLLTHKATIGNTAVVGEIPFEYIMLTPQVTYYRVADRTRLNNQYLRHYFDGHSFQKVLISLSGGGTRAYIGITAQLQLSVIVPPLPEQEAIAEVLSKADALIECLERLIARKRLLKKGVMQELLTGRRRLRGFANATTGYKQTEVGVIPEDWILIPFVQAVGTYIDYRGRTPRKLGMSWGGGDILALSANNVQMGKIDPDKEAYLGSEELYRKWMVQGECERGDVLLTMEAPLGNVAQIRDSKKYILSQRVLLIKPKDWLLRDFLAHYMRGSFFQSQLSLNSTGTTAKGIQRKKLDNLQVYFPPNKAEQDAIAEVLSGMDTEIALLEAQLAKHRQLKQGLMQKLLTGRIRLI